MAADFAPLFAALKPILANYAGRLVVKTDTPFEYTLVTKSASPYPQHKGHPMFFGSVKTGKAYVSFHLMPLYMCPALTGKIPEALAKRMQGKTCFNFKAVPEPSLARELEILTAACCQEWQERNWL